MLTDREIQQLRNDGMDEVADEILELRETAYYANGVADLAMKHRDLAEAEMRRYAQALLDIMDGIQDHHIRDETALPDDDCERIAKARADALLLLTPNTSLSPI